MADDETESDFSVPDDNDPHYTVIGRVASTWGILENLLNGCISDLALCDEQHMACVTSQLIGPARRMDALIALFVYRGGSEPLRQKLKNFQGRIQSLAEDRNRIVHDPIVVLKKTGKVHKALATARGALKYEIIPASIENMERTAKRITDANIEFSALEEEIAAEMTELGQKQLGHMIESHRDQNPSDENS